MGTKTLISLPYVLFLTIIAQISVAQKPGKYDAVYSGVPWYDGQGKVVSAHGATSP